MLKPRTILSMGEMASVVKRGIDIKWPMFEAMVITVHISEELLKLYLSQFLICKIGVTLIFTS